ncbi:MAG TPA: pirin family protein [Polyangiaceae bacterium]|nr:pirin family protein [Polyangiaceae bacterium]
MQDLLELVVEARARDLGGFVVGRVLPAPARRALGPFVFLDHMGPATFAPGQGFDVRPHPHIGLATVTSLFEGEIMHRDSLGFVQPIRPGELNWMTAGRGIVHSERCPDALRASGGELHGLQLWVALPQPAEECEPSFEHVEGEGLPLVDVHGVSVRVLAGEAYGAKASVRVHSRLFYAHAELAAGQSIKLPSDYAERGAYVVSGALQYGTEAHPERRLLVFAPGRVELTASAPTRLALLGGDPLDGARHIEWNFVSSSRERIEQAKRDWRERRFPTIPSDHDEFIPLPD